MSPFSFPPFYRDYIKFLRQTQEIEKALGITPAQLELHRAVERERQILEARRALESQREADRQRELLEQIQFQKECSEWADLFSAPVQPETQTKVLGSTPRNMEIKRDAKPAGRPTIKKEMISLLEERAMLCLTADTLADEARQIQIELLIRRGSNLEDGHHGVPKNSRSIENLTCSPETLT